VTRSLSGLQLLMDRVGPARDVRLLDLPAVKTGASLDAKLQTIAARYDWPTASFVAVQLEHPVAA
jgi:hypothetical protein